jgi:hypothetical protein
LCFFFKVDAGSVAFITTDELSQKVLTGPSTGMPNIRSLHHRLSNSSTAILMEVNSEPKVDISTVFCALEYHWMGVLFKKIKIPVCERHVIWLPA